MNETFHIEMFELSLAALRPSQLDFYVLNKYNCFRLTDLFSFRTWVSGVFSPVIHSRHQQSKSKSEVSN